MSRLCDIPISTLDLAPIREGATAGDALRASLDLARHVERWGYHRYWMAEHHGMPGIASAATSVALAFVGAGTQSIRLGSGGIMLPNHAPLMVAEQFGTLEALFPGRVDLGIGRAPGTDPATARALRRGLGGRGGEDLPELLAELQGYLEPARPGQGVIAVPGAGARVPIWLLGSSGYSARFAGELGFPYAAAGHFAPDSLMPALELYRRSFRPGALERPCAMVCVNVILADTDADAERLAASQRLSFLNLVRGSPGQLPPPVDSMEGIWSPREQAMVASFMRLSVVGGPDTARAKLETLAEETQADELMVHAMIYDHAARLRSYELVAEIARKRE